MKIIKLASRSILSFRMYSGINLLGMVLSLACVLTIFRYAHGELTVDRFNKKIDRIYVSTSERSTQPGDIAFSGISNPNNEKTFVDLTTHPGVELCSHYIRFENEEIEVDESKYNTTILLADNNFLKITDYPVISGLDILSELNNVLITKSFAQKLFGNEDPVGQSFRHSTGAILTISGIIGPIPTKATLVFDMIASYDLSKMLRSKPASQTLVLLHRGVDYRTINKQYEGFYEMEKWGYHQRNQLFPLSKVYLDNSIDNYVFHQGNYSYLKVLIAVGILILLTGIINYINICTVVVLRRGRELGVKKVFGADRGTIFIQLLIENLMLTGFALFAAFFVAKAAHPLITNVLQLDQVPSIRFDMILSFSILLSLPLLTTLFPFLRHHRSMPVNSINNFDQIRGGSSLRRIFLSFQYVITITMIIVSLFFIKQLHFMLNTEPGYETKDIIKVQFLKRQTNFTNREEREARLASDNQMGDEIEQKMNASPLFSNWIYGNIPISISRGDGFPFRLPEGENKNINLARVDADWFRFFHIELKEGRLWDYETDSSYDYSLIVTESALKLYGITDINDALLQPERRLWMSTDRPEEMKTNPPYRIIGVVKDFNYLHLSQKSIPMVFMFENLNNKYEPLIASITPGRTQDAIAFLRNLHEETAGGEFIYTFVEDEIQAVYREDKKIASIYSVFTFIAIFISSLGLFSISLFDIQQRRKEIAVRKINGAIISDIIPLLLKKYFWTLVISFVIAAPIAFFAINRYLEDFANKTPVSWWLFAIAMTLTASISLLTLIFQTQKAANQNPAEVVKKE